MKIVVQDLQSDGAPIHIYGRALWPGLEAQVVVDRYGDLLLACGVERGRLDRLVAEHELNLFQCSSFLAAEFRAAAAGVMRAEAIDPDSFGRW